MALQIFGPNPGNTRPLNQNRLLPSGPAIAGSSGRQQLPGPPTQNAGLPRPQRSNIIQQVQQLVSQTAPRSRGRTAGPSSPPRGGLSRFLPQGSLAQQDPILAGIAAFKFVVDAIEGNGVDLSPIAQLQDRRAARREAQSAAFENQSRAIENIFDTLPNIPIEQRADAARQMAADAEAAGINVGSFVEGFVLPAAQANAEGFADTLDSTRRRFEIVDDEIQGHLSTLCQTSEDGGACIANALNENFELFEKGSFERHIDDAMAKMHLFRVGAPEVLAQIEDPEEQNAFKQAFIGVRTQSQLVATARGVNRLFKFEGRAEPFSRPEIAALASPNAEIRLGEQGILTNTQSAAALNRDPTQTADLQAELRGVEELLERAAPGTVEHEQLSREVADFKRKLQPPITGLTAEDLQARPSAQFPRTHQNILTVDGITNLEAIDLGVNIPTPVDARLIAAKTVGVKNVERIADQIIADVKDTDLNVTGAVGRGTDTVTSIVNSIVDITKDVARATGIASEDAVPNDLPLTAEGYQNAFAQIGIRSRILQSKMLDLAFAIATANQPNRLSDQDINRAIIQIGGSAGDLFGASADSIKAVLATVKENARLKYNDDVKATYGFGPGELQPRLDLLRGKTSGTAPELSIEDLLRIAQ